MPRFQVSGLDAQGKSVMRTIQAADKADASRKALEQEILIQQIRPVSAGRYNIKTVEKLNFIRLLSVTSKSGLPLLTGLQTIVRESKSGGLNKLTLEMISDLEQGASVSESMANREAVFDELSIALVKAGEASGKLPETLEQLYTYQNQAYAFKRKLRSALSYPVLVFSFSFFVVGFFMAFIVPQFKETYKSFGGDLPPITDVLLTASTWMSDNLIIIATLIIASGAAIIALFRSREYRIYLEQAWLRIPVFGQIFLWGVIVRFSRTLGTLVSYQVNFLDSLFLAIEATGSVWFQTRLKNTINEIKEGDTLTDALEKVDVFPELGLQMVRMGEESGNLGELLTNMATFYQSNLDHRVSTLDSVIQPLVIIGLGLFVGFLVMALFLPMFDLPGALK